MRRLRENRGFGESGSRVVDSPNLQLPNSPIPQFPDSPTPQLPNLLAQHYLTEYGGCFLFTQLAYPLKQYCAVRYNAPESKDGQAILVIKDMNGRTIKQIEIFDESGEMIIDLTGYKSGVYSLSLMTGKNSLITKKMVVVK